jgi:murein DD-endopeptidase MepM/ murein hydrolase activator NlpD
MKKVLSSPLVSASNNIISFSGDSSRRLKGIQRDVVDFSKFLNTQNEEINRIKLPEKRKIKELANLNIASSFGSPGNLLSSLLGGALDVAGFLGNMFPPRGKMGAPQNTRGLRPPKPMVSGSKLQFGGLKSVGILNAVFSGLDFAQGLAEGESTGQAASGAVGNLAGSLLGGAIGQALIPIPGLGFVIGSMAGGFLGGWTGDRAYELATGGAGGVSGKVEEKLKAQEQQQKASVQEDSFANIITKFDESVGKFENFVYRSFGNVINAAASAAGSDQMMMDYGLDPDVVPTVPELPGEIQDMIAEGGDIPSRVVSSPFGMRDGRPHTGVDYPRPNGTPVSVIQPGQVSYAGWLDGYGYSVIISHPGGLSTLYGHLSRINTSNGQQVEPGTVIGNTGSTGRSTGPHVHFEVRRGSERLPISNSEGDKYFRFGGNIKVKPKAGVSGAGSNVFNLEIHSVGENESQRSGLIRSVIDPEGTVSKSLMSEYGSYPSGFRDLGGPKRGLNLLETDMKRGVEYNAQRLINILKKHPEVQFNLFAGHNDVTTGSTGAPGEREYNKQVAERISQMARDMKLSNIKYHPSVIANDPNDPNANWNRSKRMRDAALGMGGDDLTLETAAAYKSRMIENLQQYPSYNQLQQVTTIIPMMMGNQGGGQQKPVFIPVGGGGGGGTVIMPGPDEGQLVNSLMKTILLTNLSAS